MDENREFGSPGIALCSGLGLEELQTRQSERSTADPPNEVTPMQPMSNRDLHAHAGSKVAAGGPPTLC
jgi:hypothetical protein